MPIKNCLVLKFYFREDGVIAAYNPEDQRFHKQRISVVQKWVRALERTYSELRCYSKEELSRRHAAGIAK